MAYKILVDGSLYTTEEYKEDDYFLVFIDKFGKEVKVNKKAISYIREC